MNALRKSKQKSGLEFFRLAHKMSGLSGYKLAQMLESSPHMVYRAEQEGNEYISLTVLTKLRKLSGLTWAQFGALLDEEFIRDWKAPPLV